MQILRLIILMFCTTGLFAGVDYESVDTDGHSEEEDTDKPIYVELEDTPAQPYQSPPCFWNWVKNCCAPFACCQKKAPDVPAENMEL